MNFQFIVDLQGSKLPANVGSKSEKLYFLKQHGFRVPDTYVCNFQAHRRFRSGDETVLSTLRTELNQVLQPDKRYAVRSSASLEDSLAYSFAGQFKSLLAVQGLDNILNAVQEIWLSTESPEVVSYLQQNGLSDEDLSMAAIIQEMVEPVISGVAFSKNPTTGLDEIVVEMVQGSGELLVQDGITPERWINKWGEWIDSPEDDQSRHELAQHVVNNTKVIAQTFGAPVDLEWVFNNDELFWVQLREITTLEGLHIYSNRISREVLPGIIKPLVWSINVPLVNSAWIDLFTELIGANDIEPDDLSRSFNYRAYFNMSTLGVVFDALGMSRESLELLMGLEAGDDKPSFRPSKLSLRHIPRLVRFLVNKWRFGSKARAFIPRMREVYGTFVDHNLATYSDQELLNDIDRLYDFTKEAAYYNIVVPLSQSVYAAIFKRMLGGVDVEFEHFDLTRGLVAINDYDPNIHLAQLNSDFLSLDAQTQAQIRAMDYTVFSQLGGIKTFQESVRDFLNRFGHLSDSGNDFSAVPWRENPDLVLRMITDYSTPQGSGRLPGWEDLSLTRLQRSYMNVFYKRARAFRFYREAISFYYTFGYGLFRNYFMEIGRRLVVIGLLQNPDDIFFLNYDEIKNALLIPPSESQLLAERIAQRKSEIEACRDTIMPDIIYGDVPPPLMLVDELNVERLKGVPTSRGYYEGPVCVIEAVSEFDKMHEGAVLVIPYSDVSWTPLFAKAGAIIAESGGLLSHSSIVAREYNLPAVVSVTGACRLPDGVRVSVDGYNGEIIVHPDSSQSAI